MTRRQLMIAGLLLAALAALAVWFPRHYELRRIDAPLPPTGEARNPLYAAERYLRRLDTPARTARLPALLRDMPDTRAVILIDSNRYTFDPDANQRLLDWVSRGGALILRPGFRTRRNGEEALSDPLLEAIGVTVMPVKETVSEKAIEWTPPGSDSPLYIEDYGYTRLEGYRPDDNLGRNPNGVKLIQRRWGKGLISVLADLRFLDNRRIGDQDHALTLWHLTHSHGEPSMVWLTHAEQPAPLPLLLWWRLRPVIVAGGLLLALWLLGGLRRFGPMLPAPPAGNRGILEHIDASGRWYWRHGQADRLLARARQTLDERLQRRHPGWARLSPTQREERLSRIAGWSPEDIRAALHADASDRDGFTRLIRQIETLRKLT